MKWHACDMLHSDMCTKKHAIFSLIHESGHWKLQSSTWGGALKQQSPVPKRKQSQEKKKAKQITRRYEPTKVNIKPIEHSSAKAEHWHCLAANSFQLPYRTYTLHTHDFWHVTSDKYLGTCFSVLLNIDVTAFFATMCTGYNDWVHKKDRQLIYLETEQYTNNKS